jgi:hypothetical protein
VLPLLLATLGEKEERERERERERKREAGAHLAIKNTY